jgi:hypothetical protein
MTGSVAVDVFIGLISIFLLYSLLASIVMEAVAKYFGLREKITVKTIFKILDDSETKEQNIFGRLFSSVDQLRLTNSLRDRPLTSLFYSHPNIKNLGRNDFNRKPASISSEMFVDTFIQLLRGDEFKGQENQIELIKKNLNIGEKDKEGIMPLPHWYKDSGNTYKMSAIAKAWLQETEREKLAAKTDLSSKAITQKINVAVSERSVKEAMHQADTLRVNPMTLYQLKQILFDSHSDIDVFRKKLTTWYGETCDRAQGWYVRQTRSILFVIGFSVAAVFNVDTVQIAKKLSIDKSARDKMIEFAARLQADGNPSEFLKKSEAAVDTALTKITSNIKEANTIVGGGDRDSDTWFIGYFITAMAISLGASFWFDLLKKIMAVRQAGAPSPTSTTDDAKKKSTEEPIA